jgi:two-component system, OmpR family, phosphate regulon sensor histidine kinase PhoR
VNAIRTILLLSVGMLGTASLVAYSLGTKPGSLFVMAAAGLACAIAAAFIAREPPAPAPGPPAPLPAHRPIHEHPEFAGLFDAMRLPLLLVGDGRVRAANRSARELLGSFIVGADVRTAIRHPAAADRLANPRAGSNGGTIDLVGIGRPGQRWEMRTRALEDGSRLVMLTDQTARDAVERMRSDFVANASHELRTPLAAILGFVETLSDPDAGNDPALRTRFLSVIDKEARRMLRLVEDLLSISRIEARKAEQPTDVHDLGRLVRDALAEIAAGGDARAQDIEVDGGEGVQVRADPAQMSQLVHNIVGNAMKYGHPGTPVTVRIAAAGPQMVELSVSDRGDGIPAEALPRLTERFFRVDSARSRTLGGTGLGLAIAKHVVERHRGRLDIDSVEGQGTTVRVRLPLAGSTV